MNQYSLHPTHVNFEERWSKIKGTLKLLITLSKGVTRADWNDRFSYLFCFNKSGRLAMLVSLRWWIILF